MNGDGRLAQPGYRAVRHLDADRPEDELADRPVEQEVDEGRDAWKKGFLRSWSLARVKS